MLLSLIINAFVINLQQQTTVLKSSGMSQIQLLDSHGGI